MCDIINNNNNNEEVKLHELNDALLHHLGDLHLHNNPWELSNSVLSGRGVIATRDIEPNELIFMDRPLILGPRANKIQLILCVVCHRKLTIKDICPKGCGLPICPTNNNNNNNNTNDITNNKYCYESNEHAMECELLQQWCPKNKSTVSLNTLRALPIIKGLLLDDKRKILLSLLQGNIPKPEQEIEIIRASEEFLNFPKDSKTMKLLLHTLSVLNTNAFETLIASESDNYYSLRGLYPLSGILNHQCTPSARYSFDKNCIMSGWAARKMFKGDEITFSYVQILWGTLSRRVHLSTTKNFSCRCQRCIDPTENGSYLSALKCSQCINGKMLPINPVNLASPWSCELCSYKINAKSMSKIQEFLSTAITNQMESEKINIKDLLNFIKNDMTRLLLPSNQFAVEMKMNLITKVDTSDYTLDDFKDKEQYCKEVIDILEKLGAGECTLKAQLYYELYRCGKEISKFVRPNEEQVNEFKMYLKKCWIIQKTSVFAPKNLKNLIKEENLFET